MTFTAHEKIEKENVEIAIPNNDEIILKIKRVGICGSDIHAFHGKHPTMPPPVVLGHEFSAEVYQLGKDVKDFQVGDLVTIRPQVQCGSCIYCQTGHPNICKNLKVIGCQINGGSQEYVAIQKDLVYKLPNTITEDEGVFIEPIAVAAANVRAAGTLKGKNVLVLGAGTIGNLTAQVSKISGAATVAVTDIFAEKLRVAHRSGIEFTINSRTDNLEKEIFGLFGEDGPDIIFECVGSEITINQAIRYIKKTGKIIIVGIFSDPPVTDLLNIQEKEICMKGVLMYLDEDFKYAISLSSKKAN